MLPISRCILAIDSGGSKCDALLLRDDGTVLGRGRCDWNDPDSGRSRAGSGRSEASLTKAIRAALGTICCEEIILATFKDNFGLGKVCWRYARTLRLCAVTEYDPALILQHATEGVVIVAGTGAAVYCRRAGRKPMFLDGLGPLLGDYGSGYYIGRLALQAAAKSGWHPRYQTSLTGAVHQALGIAETIRGKKDLVNFSLDNPDRAEIAALASVVDREANADDDVANEILRQAAGALAGTVRDMVTIFSLAEEEFLLIGAGSVAVHSERYWAHLCAQVQSFAPRAIPARSPHPPVYGIALLALREYGTDSFAAMERRVLGPSGGS